MSTEAWRDDKLANIVDGLAALAERSKKPTPLADRPAANLRALMRAKGAELGLTDSNDMPRGVSARAVARGAWPNESEQTVRGRVESVRNGRWSHASTIDALAAYFEVDAGVFYQEPGQ